MKLAVMPLLMWEDNYSYILVDPKTKMAIVVDPADGEKIWAFLESNRYELEAILATHHHLDHVAGIEFLCSKRNVPVYSSERERQNISHVNRGLEDGDEIVFEERVIQAVHVPGHTLGHLVYRCEDALFSGDTLFLGGCGRLFEGTPEQMFHSLYEKILTLPEETKIYPGHEYTVRTRSFCLTIDPDNPLLKSELRESKTRREQGLPTVPGTLGTEKNTNVFLRCKNPTVTQSVRIKAPRTSDDPLSVFTQLRSMMDAY